MASSAKNADSHFYVVENGISDGTGQDVFDPTGKFQKLRRLTGRLTNV